MGCDIHSHVEVKIAGQWHHYSTPPLQRDYTLFERICGVRGEPENAIAIPRGLPENLSIVTAVCYAKEKPDAHSCTWLDRRELCDLIDWENSRRSFPHHQFGYLTGNSFHLHPGSNPPEIEDVRFICWFDN